MFLTFTYLGSCGNMSNQHMSVGLSHLQGCSATALQPRLIWFIHSKNACLSILILYIFLRKLLKIHSGLNHHFGYIVTQALVPFSVIWFTANPTAALQEVSPEGNTTMNVLFIGLALFGGKSGWDVCQVHEFLLTRLNYFSKFNPLYRETLQRCDSCLVSSNLFMLYILISGHLI